MNILELNSNLEEVSMWFIFMEKIYFPTLKPFFEIMLNLKIKYLKFFQILRF